MLVKTSIAADGFVILQDTCTSLQELQLLLLHSYAYAIAILAASVCFAAMLDLYL
jgi:hypothetical protein